MFLSVLSFLAGIVVVQQLPELPQAAWLLAALLLALFLAYRRYWRLVFCVVGFLWAVCYSGVRMQNKLPDAIEGQSIQIEGKVTGLPQYDERSVRFDFIVLKPDQVGLKKIRLSWYFPKQPIKPDQYWNFTVKLKKPHGRINPNGFDYEQWLFMHNIAATGYVKNKPNPQLVTSESVLKSVDSLRQLISDKLNHLIGNAENKGLIKALTIGDKQELTDKQWAIFRDTGTVHLLAISGLHMGLISGLTFLLMLKINSRLAVRSPHVLAAIVTVVVATFYAALAGFSLPTQRALLMLLIAMMSIIWQRNITPINILALAMLAVLIFDPLSVLSAGFWLSFLAVLLIIYSLSGRLTKAGYWKGALKIHCITAVGLSPVLLLYFQQVSVIAPVANLFTVPIISLIVVPLCLLGVAMLFISPLIATAVFDLINSMMQGLIWVLEKLSVLPFATVTLSTPPLYAIFLALLGVFVLFSPRGVPARWLALLLMLPLIFQRAEKLTLGEINLTVLDVGQGLSAVVQTTNHMLLFDTGAKYSKQYDMGNAVIVPFLKNTAIKTIDTLVISHGDNDHIGGANSILEQVQVKKILTSVPEQFAEYSPVLCQAGQSWLWDQVLFEILSPMKNNILIGDNNNSCVLRISSVHGSLLLPGDIEASAESNLVTLYGDQLGSDVLVAPHHGSKTSSSISFIKQVQPQVVLIPSGYRNRFSFPHQQVLDRYQQINTIVFNTANDGALRVKLKDNKKFIVESIRKIQRKYWNN